MTAVLKTNIIINKTGASKNYYQPLVQYVVSQPFWVVFVALIREMLYTSACLLHQSTPTIIVVWFINAAERVQRTQV